MADHGQQLVATDHRCLRVCVRRLLIEQQQASVVDDLVGDLPLDHEAGIGLRPLEAQALVHRAALMAQGANGVVGALAFALGQIVGQQALPRALDLGQNPFRVHHARSGRRALVVAQQSV
jgi:hypothetical protein